jgi:hypothetical protein
MSKKIVSPLNSNNISPVHHHTGIWTQKKLDIDFTHFKPIDSTNDIKNESNELEIPDPKLVPIIRKTSKPIPINHSLNPTIQTKLNSNNTKNFPKTEKEETEKEVFNIGSYKQYLKNKNSLDSYAAELIVQKNSNGDTYKFQDSDDECYSPKKEYKEYDESDEVGILGELELE